MSMILLKLTIILVLFFVGYGFTEILLPEKFKEKAFWFYPWLASVLIIFFGTALYYGVMSLNPGIYFIISITTFLFIYSFFRKQQKHLYLKENIIVLLTVIIFSILFTPRVNLSLLNVKAEFLKNNSIAATEVLNRSFFQDTSLIGPGSLIAFFSILLKQKISITIDLVSSVYLLLLYPLVFNIFRKNTVFIKKPIFLAILSAALLFIIYYLFRLFNFTFIHLIFLGIALIFMILIKDYLSLIAKIKKYIIRPTLFELLITVTLFSLATISPLGFKLILGILIFIGLFYLLFQKRKKVLFYLTKIVIFSVILNPIIIGVILWSK